jgi:hypothetical protein
LARPRLGANTTPTTIDYGDSASAGTAGANQALADHRHGVDLVHDHSASAEGNTLKPNTLHLPTGGIITNPGAPGAAGQVIVPVDGSGYVNDNPHLVVGDGSTSNKRLAYLSDIPTVTVPPALKVTLHERFT